MKLLALLEDPAGPSARLRFHAFRPALERIGCEVEVQGLPRAGPRRWRILWAAAAADVVFVQRRLLPAWEVALLRRRARRLVYDLDDALYLRDRPPHRSTTREWRFRAWVRAADVVLAGNRVLLEAVQARGGRAVRMPTTVPAVAGLGKVGRDLIWIGQASTTRYLADILEDLEPLAAEEGLVVRAVGAEASQLRRFGDWVRPVEWSPSAEVEALRSGGIGLAPLADDPWTAGKCGLRLLRYLAHGMRAVASGVGCQVEIAAGCDAVRLVRRPDDWSGEIRAFLGADQAQVAELALAAESRSREYTPGAWTRRFLEAVVPPNGSSSEGTVAGEWSER